MKKPKSLAEYGPARFNPKRTIVHSPEEEQLKTLSVKALYTGSPYHKKNPGDFGLTPPSHPRPDKTLCDLAEVTSRDEAQELLRKGIEFGMISRQTDQNWPKHVWAVKETDEKPLPLEAILENAGLGQYHGYPMQEIDPFHKTVLETWSRRVADE